MIAADTSTWIAYFAGEDARDTDLLDRALANRQVLMVPAVLTELLSDPHLNERVSALLLSVPLMQTTEGYWQRAGALRASVLGRRRKARLGDALIAQSCIDRGVILITRDADFRAFADAAELSIAFGAR